MARHKEYIKECVECGKTFVATREDAKTCSGACRSKQTRDRNKKVLVHLTGRNVYHGIIVGQYVKIRCPEGSDIAKELNLNLGTERLIKSIEGNKRYVVEYIPMK